MVDYRRMTGIHPLSACKHAQNKQDTCKQDIGVHLICYLASTNSSAAGQVV